MIIYTLILIAGVTIGYGIGLAQSLEDLYEHLQEILKLNYDWFKHLENLTNAVWKDK